MYLSDSDTAAVCCMPFVHYWFTINLFVSKVLKVKNYCFLCRLVSLKNFNQFELTDRLLRTLSVLFHADLISLAVDYSIITVGSVTAAQWRFYGEELNGAKPTLLSA